MTLDLDKSRRYLRWAVENDKRAGSTVDPELKRMFRRIAAQYRELALQTTGLMGAIGYFLSYQAIFLASAALALPMLVALARIRSTDIHFGRACGQPDHDAPTPPPRARRLSLWKNHNLLTFAGCLFLFQLGNASMLPLAGEELVYRNGTDSSLTISALIIVPQIIVALTAPWAGRQAQSWGRRPLLLIGSAL
jgi:hypothetical protein